jgi:hypothetical protein
MPSCLPFITYGYQDDGILGMVDAITAGYDMGVDKSRDMGVTWIGMGVIDWMWRFHDERSFLLLSRKEDYVDKKDNPDCLFAKLDYIEDRLPTWLRVLGRERTKMHLFNPGTRSVIDGESTNENAGRGGRRSAVWRDEEAFCDNGLLIDKALSDNTNCQLRVSTPNGTGNSFYLAKLSGINWKSFHWTRHPEKARGLYRVEDHQVVEIDTGYDFTGYAFVVDQGDGLRSPWYDRECKRRNSKVAIAQELDIDYLASGSMFFDAQVLALVKVRDCRPAFHVGHYSKEVFEDMGHGPLSLWFHPSPQGRPDEKMTYVLGADIAAGTGASDSVAVVYNCKTGEKMAEYVNNMISPEGFADVCAELANWFSTEQGKCYMIWEATGPGGIFGKRILGTHRYSHYYKHVADDGKKRTGARAGWYSSKQGKEILLGEYRSDLAGGRIVNRSELAVAQCEEYIFTGNGVEHNAERGGEDPSGNKEQHGDRVIADALAARGMRNQVRPKKDQPATPLGCFAWRREQARLLQIQNAGWLE